MRLHIGCPTEVHTFRDLLDALPDTEFPHLNRSTIPLLQWWRDDGLSVLADKIGWSCENGEAWFEYSVSPNCKRCGGRGKSSFTDLMLRLGDVVAAIEAKHNETLYDSVSKWLGNPPSENKQKVLHHWTTCCIDPAIDPAICHQLVYQMVHRTASACHVADKYRAHPHVVHLLFGSAHLRDYIVAVESLAKALHARRDLQFYVANVPTSAGPDYTEVEEEHHACGADAIREALSGNKRIYTFEAPDVNRIAVDSAV